VGADDYVVKPFSPREAVLRVRALLRRSERLGATSMLPRTVRVGSLSVDLQARSAQIGGGALSLTHREFDLLVYLMTHPGEVFTKEALLGRVWGWDFGDTSTVTVHVRRLREKIEADPSDPRLVVTVRGTGYRFDGDANA
jgi:DNA-binding response OmpR family regulator